MKSFTGSSVLSKQFLFKQNRAILDPAQILSIGKKVYLQP